MIKSCEINDSTKKIPDIIGVIGDIAFRTNVLALHAASSVRKLETMTQQNATLVEESAAAAESLRDQAERLNPLVRALRPE